MPVFMSELKSFIKFVILNKKFFIAIDITKWKRKRNSKCFNSDLKILM